VRARHSAVNLSMHARLSDHQLRKLQHHRLCSVSTVHVHARYEGGKPLHDVGLGRTLLLRSDRAFLKRLRVPSRALSSSPAVARLAKLTYDTCTSMLAQGKRLIEVKSRIAYAANEGMYRGMAVGVADAACW